MKKNIVIGILSLVLVGTNAWQFMGLIDQGITMSYMDRELHNANRANAQMEKVIGHFMVGKSAEEAEALLKEIFPEELFYTKEGHIHSGALSFKLNESGKTIETVGWFPDA